ncbi:MAG TPA: glycosyltransferase [Gammaproteobacteria bacterium]|nr:glycosyltransferase [Gammaproteobacteria bacterium]
MKTGCVSIVVPVLNEAENLGELIRRCTSVGCALRCDFELIVVDDGSTDESPAIVSTASARDPQHVVSVRLNRNYGQHAAVLAGLAQARGDVIVTLDGDLQNPPEEIPRLLAVIEEGYDIVGAVRRRREDSWLRVAASGFVNRLMARATGIYTRDFGCMLRAYRREIVDAVLACRERNTYVPALANSFAGRIGEVIVEHSERRAGRSKYRVWSLINLYFDMLVSTTTAPLRLLSIVGGALAVIGAAFGVLLLALRLVYGPDWAAQGVFTIFAVLFLFLGIQLVGMGLLGEYVGRISRDVQARPRFIVREVVGSGWSASGEPRQVAARSAAGDRR